MAGTLGICISTRFSRSLLFAERYIRHAIIFQETARPYTFHLFADMARKIVFFTLFIGYLAYLTAAEFTLSDLQPIAQFSDSCSEAYNTPIVNCTYVSFAPFQEQATCSRKCLNELNALVPIIQSGCQNDGVRPDTVIAHAFQGDLANWLCGSGDYATTSATVASGTATNAKATMTSTESSTSTSSATEASTTSSTITPSSTTLLTSSSRTSSSASSRSSPTQNNVGDSTPFDQTVGANDSRSEKEKLRFLTITIIVPIVVTLTIGSLGGWIY